LRRAAEKGHEAWVEALLKGHKYDRNKDSATIILQIRNVGLIPVSIAFCCFWFKLPFVKRDVNIAPPQDFLVNLIRGKC
jgi:hypothetical protein